MGRSNRKAKPTKAAENDMNFNGALSRDADGRQVTVLEGASIEGDLGAHSVVIRGIVKGIVRATSIAVRSTALVQGELRYGTLSVDPGARLEAKCVPTM